MLCFNEAIFQGVTKTRMGATHQKYLALIRSLEHSPLCCPIFSGQEEKCVQIELIINH